MKTTVSSNGVAQRSGPTGWPDGATVPVWCVGQTGTRAGAQRRADGRPSEADGCPTEGGSRGGPTGRVVCASVSSVSSVCLSVTSDKVHVRPISKYSSIFEHIEHILENIHRICPLRPIPNRQNRPSVRPSRPSTTSLPPNPSDMTTLPTGDYIRAPAPHFWALSSSV
jgi:hypothetical protein